MASTTSPAMPHQLLAVDTSRVQTELVHAFVLDHRTGPFDFDLNENEESFFVACISGDLIKLQELLSAESLIATAIESKKRPFSSVQPTEICNLLPMLHMAVRAGSAPMTRLLLKIAEKHNISYKDLISRHTVFAAIDCQILDVLTELIHAYPGSVNLGGDILGNPLSYTIGKSHTDRAGVGLIWDKQTEIEYVRVLLEGGANANAKVSPSSTLRSAALKSPVEVTSLLMKHGATVLQSGAIQAAAKANRVDVLDILVKQGADVNEQLQEPILRSSDTQKVEQHLSETPLHIAVREKSYEATSWLLKNGADRTIKDSSQLSPIDSVVSSRDRRMDEIFGLEASH